MNAPVLARTFETKGFSTVLVTNMPYWVEKTGVPRTLAVEVPFATTLGAPGDTVQQMSTINQALTVLENAQAPGLIVHSPDKWSQPHEEALKSWQPSKPSPIIEEMAPKIRTLLRQRRREQRTPKTNPGQ